MIAYRLENVDWMRFRRRFSMFRMNSPSVGRALVELLDQRTVRRCVWLDPCSGSSLESAAMATLGRDWAVSGCGVAGTGRAGVGRGWGGAGEDSRRLGRRKEGCLGSVCRGTLD